MSARIGVADTCFLIDWSSFSRRDLIKEVFSSILIMEQVLAEAKTRSVIEWIAKNLAEGFFILYTPLEDEINEARELILRVARLPFTRRIEVPEALCLVIARKINSYVLTENRGALMVIDVFEEYSNVKAWRSLELLREIAVNKLNRFKEASELIMFYQRETHHIFPEEDLNSVMEVIKSVLKE
ncbi:MAG: hypothetical protein QXP91_11875 [Candidatus Methanomethylicia archaeon]